MDGRGIQMTPPSTRNRRIVYPRKPARVKLPNFRNPQPTRATYIALFIGGDLDNRSQPMYGKTSQPPWASFDKAEYVGNRDGSEISKSSGSWTDAKWTADQRHITYTRHSNFYALSEPIKKVGMGCPTFVYQYQPNFQPPVKDETPNLV